MKNSAVHKYLNIGIASVWLINGLFCKVLNLVPRHREIVERILGNRHSAFFTSTIGLLETAMAVWILSGVKARINTIFQICVIAIMNALEYFLVPDLLLWGRLNAVFAFMLIILIYYNEFHLNKRLV